MSDQVTFSISETVNSGNYESTKIMVGITTDVRPKENSDSALDRAVSFVKLHVARELELLEQE